MHMTSVDWLVLAVPVVLVALVALKTRRYTRSVADFMAANRCAGRYLVATAQGEASYGAANIVAQFELFFLAPECLNCRLNFAILDFQLPQAKLVFDRETCAPDDCSDNQQSHQHSIEYRDSLAAFVFRFMMKKISAQPALANAMEGGSDGGNGSGSLRGIETLQTPTTQLDQVLGA